PARAGPAGAPPATWGTGGGPRPASSSWAPAAARATAVAAPIPDEAPVMSATAPLSRMPPHSGAPTALSQARHRVRPSGGGGGVLGRAQGPGFGPAPNDVAHREQARDVTALEHDQAPDPGPDHGGCGLLQRPFRRREDHIRGPVGGCQLGVGILACANGVEDVALGQDAYPGVLVVDDHRGAYLSPGHQTRGLTKR